MDPNKHWPRKPAYRGDARTGWAIRRYNDIALGITDAHERNSPEPDEELDDDYNDDEYVADEEEGEKAAKRQTPIMLAPTLKVNGDDGENEDQVVEKEGSFEKNG